MCKSKSADKNIKSFSQKGKKAPRPPKKITERYLRNSGLYYLQRYTASSGHFRQVMMRKIKRSCMHHKDQNIEDCAKILEDIIIEFCEMRLLDDEAYGKAMVTSFRRRGHSKAQILQKLSAKSMNREYILQLLDGFDEDMDLESAQTERLSALKFAKKKRVGPFRKPGDDYDFNKELAKFARAGFGFDIARAILDMPFEAADEELSQSVL